MESDEVVLVTGATGFVGSVLCEELARAGYRVRAALRSDRAVAPSIAQKAVVGDIGSATDWRAALDGVTTVMHLAARAHVLKDSPANADLYMETNARGTQRLAAASVQAGVARLIFLSSVKVNGEGRDHAYTADEQPHPQDVYGTSKWQAEQHIREIATGSSLQFSILRPPLVYGPGVRANFRRLLRWVDRGVPLPLGAVANRRSLVSVWNVCDLLMRLMSSPSAASRAWLVSDDEDLATPDLIRRIARAMHRRPRLVSISPRVLQVVGRLVGKGPDIDRLCGSLTVDISHTKRVFGWSPRVPLDEALARTVAWYVSQ
jgi:nucleoside-diphosphate-sugar epimerase